MSGFYVIFLFLACFGLQQISYMNEFMNHKEKGKADISQVSPAFEKKTNNSRLDYILCSPPFSRI